METTRSAVIARTTVTVSIEQESEKLADWLLAVLAKAKGESGALQDGERIQVGWSTITLRRMADDALHVFEPDFLTDAHSLVLGATRTLTVHAAQMEFAYQLAVEPEITAYFEKVIIEKDCLDQSNLFLNRSKPDRKKADSGWFVGIRQRTDSTPVLEAIYAYQLLQRRPALMPALILPPGYIVFADTSGIEGVANERNEPVYERPT